MKRRVFETLAMALSVLGCFVCLEIGLRFWGPKYYRFNNNSDEYYSNPRDYFDPVRREGDLIIYGLLYDNDGDPERRVPEDQRSDEEIEAFLARECAILGLGDSFTYGQGVRFQDPPAVGRRIEDAERREIMEWNRSGAAGE